MSTTEFTSKINPEVQLVSDDIFKHVKIHKDGTSTGQDDRYPKFLEGRGLKVEDADRYHEADAIFIAGTTHGVGRATESHFVKHPGATDLTVKVPMAMNGRNYLQVAAEREHTYATPGRNGEPAGSVTKHNDITTKYHIVEANVTAGQLKIVKQDLNASAREALAGAKA